MMKVGILSQLAWLQLKVIEWNRDWGTWPPPSQIIFHTMACFPDPSSFELQMTLPLYISWKKHQSSDIQCLVSLPSEPPPHRLQQGQGEIGDWETQAQHESVGGKIRQKEFVVASPQLQQVIASFTGSGWRRKSKHSSFLSSFEQATLRKEKLYEFTQAKCQMSNIPLLVWFIGQSMSRISRFACKQYDPPCNVHVR